MGNGAKIAQIIAIILAIELVFSAAVRWPVADYLVRNNYTNRYIDNTAPTVTDPVITPTSPVAPTTVPTTTPVIDADTTEEFVSDYKLMWDFNPYYDRLNDSEKKVYESVYNCLINAENSIDLTSYDIDKSSLKKINDSVYCDHPEVFWYEGDFHYRFESGTGKLISYEPVYTDLTLDLEKNKKAFNKAANEYLAAAKSETRGEIYQELCVHNMISQRCTYVTDSDYNQSAYSCLVNGKTVCSGYARAFQYLMLRLGIKIYYVSGEALGDDNKYGPHAWNIIVLNNDYYNVDVTWDDTDNDQVYRFDYFNISDSKITSDHKRDSFSADLPKCTSTEQAYDSIAA